MVVCRWQRVRCLLCLCLLRAAVRKWVVSRTRRQTSRHSMHSINLHSPRITKNITLNELCHRNVFFTQNTQHTHTYTHKHPHTHTHTHTHRSGEEVEHLCVYVFQLFLLNLNGSNTIAQGRAETNTHAKITSQNHNTRLGHI